MTITLQEREKQICAKELECEELWRELVAERSLRTQKELECKGLRVDVCTTQKVTVELQDGLEASRAAI